MTTQAKIGHGNQFKIGNGAVPEVFTACAEVTNITPPGLSRDSHDVSHMNSPEKWREFIMGLKDGGEVSIELNFVPGSATTLMLMAELDTDTVGNKQIVFTTGEVWSFAAGLTGFESESPVGDAMTASATFKISGKPSLA